MVNNVNNLAVLPAVTVLEQGIGEEQSRHGDQDVFGEHGELQDHVEQNDQDDLGEKVENVDQHDLNEVDEDEVHDDQDEHIEQDDHGEHKEHSDHKEHGEHEGHAEEGGVQTENANLVNHLAIDPHPIDTFGLEPQILGNFRYFKEKVFKK